MQHNLICLNLLDWDLLFMLLWTLIMQCTCLLDGKYANEPWNNLFWFWVYCHEAILWVSSWTMIQTTNDGNTMWIACIDFRQQPVCPVHFFNSGVYFEEEGTTCCLLFHAWGICLWWVKNWIICEYSSESCWPANKVTGFFWSQKVRFCEKDFTSYIW